MEETESRFESERSESEKVFVRGAAELNQLLKIHQVWNLDQLVAPFIELLPDTADPFQAILTMSHIYNWPNCEIVSVLADAQFKPIQNAGWQEKKLQITQDPESQFKNPELNFRYTKLQFEIPEAELPDSFDLGIATQPQLARRLEIVEDIICYMSEGVRRQTDDRSPAYMVEQAHQLASIYAYSKHLHDRMTVFDEINGQGERIKLKTMQWQNNVSKIFNNNERAFSEALEAAKIPPPAYPETTMATIKTNDKNYTEACALEEDCSAAQTKIAQMAEKSKGVIRKRANWLAFVAQLDLWRAELDETKVPPQNDIDWRHNKISIPIVHFGDDILPINNYGSGLRN
mgnify:CR=1 FL=1